MYHMSKKAEPGAAQSDLTSECFTEKVGAQLVALGVLCAVLIVCALVSFSKPDSLVSVSRNLPQPAYRLQAQTVAMVRCPYCPGLVDPQGRCNIPECPIYDPNYGTGAMSAITQVSLTGGVLIKELAIEANDAPGGVIASAVYLGGWADKADLKAGDTIVRFNGRRVKDLKHFQSLVARAKPEASIKVRALRNDEVVKLRITIGEGEMEAATVPSAPPAG